MSRYRQCPPPCGMVHACPHDEPDGLPQAAHTVTIQPIDGAAIIRAIRKHKRRRGDNTA